MNERDLPIALQRQPLLVSIGGKGLTMRQMLRVCLVSFAVYVLWEARDGVNFAALADHALQTDNLIVLPVAAFLIVPIVYQAFAAVRRGEQEAALPINAAARRALIAGEPRAVVTERVYYDARAEQARREAYREPPLWAVLPPDDADGPFVIERAPSAVVSGSAG